MLNLTLMLMLLFATSQAATISVPGDYASIQAAIDAAEDGDLIEVESGIYQENVNVDRPLILRGLGMPVVDAGGDGNAITLSADRIALEGFVATNASSRWDAGIKVASSYNSIEGSNTSYNNCGIRLTSSSNNSIVGSNASYNDCGIRLTSSSNNSIVGNNAIGNEYGIDLWESSNNTMSDNLMSCNLYNFGSDGYNDIDTSNLVDGKPVYYLVGVFGAMIDSSSDAGAVYCVDCENITVKGSTLRNNRYGIGFDKTINSKIENNNISGNSCGIDLLTSNNNTIEGNNVSDNGFRGIQLEESNNNTIKGNNVSDNDDGIFLFSSRNNTIVGNTANGNRYGILFHSSSNNTVEGNNASDNDDCGIRLDGSSNNNIIEGNNANNNDCGISLYFSSNNSMRGNMMSGNRYNFGADGYNDIDTTNFVDGKPVYYLVGASDKVIDSSSNAGVVYCIGCENITVSDLVLKNNSDGVCFHNTCNSKIENNNASNNDHGIRLTSSSNNSIEGNNAIGNNYYGIWLDGSSNNGIEGNNASGNNYDGIWLISSSNNDIEGNSASGNNRYGIRLYFSSNNDIEGNKVSGNNRYGIRLYFSSNNNTIEGNNVSDNGFRGIQLEESNNNNTLFMNNLVDNDRDNAHDDGTNCWDNGTLGNYYSDFNCTDTDGDGICDSVRRIPGGESVDRYPLARMW